MYEKLDKLRTELKRSKQKKAELDSKIKVLEQKLKEAESAQILADVGALHLTPEQLASFLKLVSQGKFPITVDEEKEALAEASVCADENNDSGDEQEVGDNE